MIFYLMPIILILIPCFSVFVCLQGRICRKAGKSKKAFSRKEAEATFKSLVKTHEKYGWVSPPVSDGWGLTPDPSDPRASRTKPQLAPTRKTTHHANSNSHLHRLSVSLNGLFSFSFVCLWLFVQIFFCLFLSRSHLHQNFWESRHIIISPPVKTIISLPLV